LLVQEELIRHADNLAHDCIAHKVFAEMSVVPGRLPVMTGPSERPKVPPAGGEREILTTLLDRHRATVAWKCGG
jgi:hypothetical protein